jgi:pimeloyl-ACP methyl ester carboxylesterase
MSKIFFEERGQGHPLVLIHGFCETRELWFRFAESLSGSYRILLPDLPGFGHSPLPAESFSVDDIGAIMLEWLTEIEVEKPILIGHSLGGYVAMAMVEQHPDLFRAFGLFHSTAYPDSTEKKANRNKVIEFVGQHGALPFLETFVPGLFFQKHNPFIPQVYDMTRQSKAESIQAYAAAMRDRPSRKTLLQSFHKHVLILAGEQDTAVPFMDSLEQSTLLTNPLFYGLKDVGHMGMFESEQECLTIVRNFADLVFG